MKCSVILLAAGKGSRMKSNTIKVLHPLAGRPVLAYSLDIAGQLNPQGIFVVVGYQGEKVEKAFADYHLSLDWVVQPEQRGTADAVRCALPSLSPSSGTIVVLYGDVPLLRVQTLQDLLAQHHKEDACITLLTACLDDPHGYGRILRNGEGRICRIVEQADADEQELRIKEINTGIYCFRSSFLLEAIDKLEANNAQGEYYLTDLIAYAASKGLPIQSKITDEPFRALGINSRKDLAEAEATLRQEICERWMLEGVTIVDPAHTYIEPSVIIGSDTVIEPNCHLKGNTHIGPACIIGTGSVIKDSKIGHKVQIRPYCVIQESEAGDGTVVGPVAHLRSGTVLEKESLVGNFVEIKKTLVGEGSKAAHLTYLGDCEIGKDVNIGCGTITCNYDGSEKHRTIIEDNAFIGSDSQLVAPVTIGKGAYVGSGSTITKDVPAESLAITRVRQKSIEGWAQKKKNIKAKK